MAKALRDLIKKNVMVPAEKFKQVDKPGYTNTGGKGTKAFAAKHTVDRVDDANGNDDDMFKGANVKKASYPRAHAGDGVSEETLDEVSKALLGRYMHRATSDIRNSNAAIGRRDKGGLGLHPSLRSKPKEVEYDTKNRREAKSREKGMRTAIKKVTGSGLWGGDSKVRVKATEETVLEHSDEVTANPISHFSHHLSAANEHLRKQDEHHFASQNHARKAAEAEGRKDKKLTDIYRRLSGHCHDLSMCHTEAAQEHLRKHLAKEMKMDEEFLLEFEQLDEVSKNTLVRYIDKAAGSLGSAAMHNKFDQYSKRRTGINRAAKKLGGIRMMSSKDNGANATRVPATEETQLDEVSKALLGRYVKKASKDAAGHALSSGMYSSSQNNYGRPGSSQKAAERKLGKAFKRLSGIEKATDRMSK